MATHRCDECGRSDFKSAGGLAAHRRSKHPVVPDGDVLAAVNASVGAATHLTDMDSGAVEVLRSLARTIDEMRDREPGSPLDNVTIPTFFKYATELGLTPQGRAKMEDPREGRSGSKLGKLRQAARTGR